MRIPILFLLISIAVSTYVQMVPDYMSEKVTEQDGVSLSPSVEITGDGANRQLRNVFLENDNLQSLSGSQLLSTTSMAAIICTSAAFMF